MNRRTSIPIGMAWLVGATLAWPSLSQAATCTISPQNPSINRGQSVTWTRTYSGFSGTPSHRWTFQGGNPSSSTSSSRTVSYANAGTFTTSLRLTRGSTVANCSTTVNVRVPDTQAPTAPSNLSASPVSSTQINLTWSASTDNVGVTGYRLERCTGASCTNFAQIATPTTTSYGNTGLTANTSYRYRVRATDAAGNLSPYSGIANAATPGATPNISINSTSQDSLAEITTTVPQQPQVANTNYSVLAINDLGMHCGDLDTRIASILPPFQVLLAQVIQKGAEPVLNPAGVSLYYSAAANPNDPVLGQNLFEGMKVDGSTYKTNFWDTVDRGAYDPFYPAFNPFVPAQTLTPLAGPPFNVGPDVGLPVPNVEDLYIGPDGILKNGDESLTAVLHAMPGISNPYIANSPRLVQEHYLDKPFFVNFPFGYVANDVDWYEGAGVPFAAFDDQGRENPYPLVRVQAKNAAGSVLTTVDTVLPISGEASCTNCHSDPADVSGSRSSVPTTTLRNAGLPVAISLDDPDTNMPQKVSVEYAADINVLRLHDLKHGSRYVSTACDNVPAGENCLGTAADPCTINAANPNGTPSCLTNKALVQNKPVVCQVCHYTPALDLAQLGPMAGAPGTLANGRNQLAHQSNSRVMHHHHGGLPGNLFPAIPAPIQDATGLITNQAARLTALDNSCYQCHPGKNTKCLRGAMFNGGMLCSDCHGNMAQVGDDFSKNVSPTSPGAFLLAKDFYTNPNTPRVPWANEPGCGSCHTGDSLSNLAGTTGTLVNTKDAKGNTDGIRLRQAFRTGDAKATPIVPTNKKFAEPLVPASFNGSVNPGAGNPKLYRVSSGHGGVMCEGCHGATHAEWPNASPTANDNVTANQLQGHTGTIVECATCHGTAMNSQNTLGGPHGMHPVGANTNFADGGHEDMVSGNNCVVCHGPNATENGRKQNTGTVLSLAKADRNFSGLEDGGQVLKGQPVGCSTCHK